MLMNSTCGKLLQSGALSLHPNPQLDFFCSKHPLYADGEVESAQF